MKRWMLIPAALLGAATGGALVKKLWLKKYRQQKMELDLAERERDMLHTWLLLEQRGVQVTEYFETRSYKRIAIFGMGRTGRCLVDALGDMAAYGVEQDDLGAVHERLTVYRLGDDPLPPADCMVICDLERIEEKTSAAQKGFPNEIVTLSEILAWLLERHSSLLS